MVAYFQGNRDLKGIELQTAEQAERVQYMIEHTQAHACRTPVIGRKIDTLSSRSLSELVLTGPVFGYLNRDSLLIDGGSYRMDPGNPVGINAQLALVFGQIANLATQLSARSDEACINSGDRIICGSLNGVSPLFPGDQWRLTLPGFDGVDVSLSVDSL